MSTNTTGNRNPFLSDDEDNSYWVTTKCRMPNCDENTAKGHLACLFHLQSSISPKASKSLDSRLPQGPSRPIDARPDAGPSPTSSRKNLLDPQFTLRKSAAPGRQTRPPFHPADSRVNYSLPAAQDRVTNGHAKSSLQRPLDHATLDNHARKRQRILSPQNDDSGFDSAPSASPLAFPSAFLSQNGDSNMPQPAKLPILNGDAHTFSPGAAKAQERATTVYSSYGDYLKTPINECFGIESNVANIHLNENASRLHRAEPSPPNPLRNISLERAQKPNTTPLRATPTKTTTSKARRASQGERTSDSQYPRLKPVARTPPLEKQRRRLAEQDTSGLDAFVYGQQRSSTPPPGVEIRHEVSEPKLQDNVFYAHIDPRIHRAHSKPWFQQKEAEIKARGGRKANFGKAVQRMKEQRLKEKPEDFEATLPDRVRHNENWVSALRWFESGGRESTAAPQAAAPATPVRTKRQYIRRKPLMQPMLEKRNPGQDP